MPAQRLNHQLRRHGFQREHLLHKVRQQRQSYEERRQQYPYNNFQWFLLVILIPMGKSREIFYKCFLIINSNSCCNFKQISIQMSAKEITKLLEGSQPIDTRREVMKGSQALDTHSGLMEGGEVFDILPELVEGQSPFDEFPELLFGYQDQDARSKLLEDTQPFQISLAQLKGYQRFDPSPLTIQTCKPEILSSLPDSFEGLLKEINKFDGISQKTLMEIQELEKKVAELIDQSAAAQLLKEETEQKIKKLENKVLQNRFMLKHAYAKVTDMLSYSPKGINASHAVKKEEPPSGHE